LRVLGVDPGSSVTGYGIVDVARDGRMSCVAAGAIRARAASFEQRLVAIYDGLSAVTKDYRPNEAAIEAIFYATNVQTALKLGHARGVAVLALAHAQLAPRGYSPLEVKRAVVGYGRAEKEQVARRVCTLLGLSKPPQPLDATDALAVAICHVNTGSVDRLEIRS